MNNKDLNIINNEMLKITTAASEFIYHLSENASIACMNIDTKDFVKLFNICFCITIHFCQGQSYDHPYSIYECEKLDERLKYVSLCRSTKKSLFNLI